MGTTYTTIQAAVNAAVNGDAPHTSTGRYVENVQVYNKNISLKGGYSAADYTTFLPYTSTIIDGSGSATSALRITNGVVFMNYVRITGGSGNPGAGVNVRYAVATAEYWQHRQRGIGGGVFVSMGTLQLTWFMISNNAASIVGGVAASVGGLLATHGTDIFTIAPARKAAALDRMFRAKSELSDCERVS